MTKMEFDTLLDKASSGDVKSMRILANICYKMVEAGTSAGDIKMATTFMGVGDGWRKLSEQGGGFGSVSDEVKNFTRDAFSSCF